MGDVDMSTTCYYRYFRLGRCVILVRRQGDVSFFVAPGAVDVFDCCDRLAGFAWNIMLVVDKC